MDLDMFVNMLSNCIEIQKYTICMFINLHSTSEGLNNIDSYSKMYWALVCI